MTAPDTQPQDTQSAAAIWWEALQVMGKRPQYDGDTHSYYIQEPNTMRHMAWKKGDMVLIHTNHWQLFGLAVEWIEARGGILGSWDGRDGLLRIYMGGDEVGYEEASAPDLPTAAARWVVEHGHKIAKEATK